MTQSSNGRKADPQSVNWDSISHCVSSNMKVCAKCGDDKDESEFFKDKRSSDGLQSYCKKCKSKLVCKYYKDNPSKAYKRDYSTGKYKEKGRRDYYRHRVHQNIARVLRKDLKGNKNNKTFTILGYTVGELKKHLEEQFKEGMSWDNYGDWHIDHIIPRDALPYKTIQEENFKRCWSLINLQPLWKIDNLKKSNKYAPFV